MPHTEPVVVLFDGVCNLCNAAVRFIIDRDPAGRFQFAPLQSAAGQELLSRHGLDAEQLQTIVLVEDGRAYTRSTAALRIARRLRAPWSLLYGLIALPAPLRDWAYDLVGRNRYRWFGRRESCRIPTPEERARFLE